jgi:hypothetical protein
MKEWVPVVAGLVEEFQPAGIALVVERGGGLEIGEGGFLLVVGVAVVVVGGQRLFEGTLHTVPTRVPAVEELVLVAVETEYR